MELRKLQATDLFSMVKILNGVGLKNFKDAIDINKIKEMRKSMTDENSDVIASKVGTNVVMSILGTLIENLPKVENDVYEFAGNVAGMKAKDVAKMEAGDFIELLISIFSKDEFKDFFSRASKLIK